jgi:antitoxin ChpS
MHTTNLRKVGGSVMLAVPLLDILRLGLGARVGIAIESGRLVVAPQKRPRYTLDQLIAQCDPKAARHKKNARGLIAGPWAANRSDEVWRDRAVKPRSFTGGF